MTPKRLDDPTDAERLELLEDTMRELLGAPSFIEMSERRKILELASARFKFLAEIEEERLRAGRIWILARSVIMKFALLSLGALVPAAFTPIADRVSQLVRQLLGTRP